jgi:hypothetical protein
MSELWAGESKNLTALATGGKLISAKYRVTTEYVYLDSGIVSSKGEQIPMWAIRDCDLNASILQKARGVANLRLICEHNDFTGKREVVLQDIEGAKELRDLVNKHSKEARIAHEVQQKTQTVNYTGGSPIVAPAPAASSPAEDPLEKLEKLGNLLAKGLLTQEEFNAQKAKLLGL